MNEKKLRKPVVQFILLTNLIFLPLFCLVGAIKFLGYPTWIFDIVLGISAWSSTFAFAALFKKIYPGHSFIQFIKNKFKNRLKLSALLTASMIQIFIFLMILFFVSTTSEADSLFTKTSWGVLVYYFFKTLLSGPLGEELGWRGFALLELQKKYPPLLASIIIGFWWGLWHLPIWFTTGYMGMDLINYSFFFMIAIISTTILMTAFYNLNRNLTIPIAIHFFFNFFIGLIKGNLIDLIMYNAFLYGIAAFLIIVINPKNVLYGKKNIIPMNGNHSIT
ncbi:CPBP family intramembrane glutamic endopeptidase [Sporosarcina sp. Te-1]|uniref:CPBP family intramembrane glutamic endopeptidase n=1 Tax=Sporosarcina sp. Te-1 TaxID=2818390 RepID=UPI001A9CC148|nr:type II CAAX endopeptidase family protein [Sporosarcina sp. Te-1]QTD40454.1 CPBP family intramembrane metalloprotease [Sporosarcina sp. Te-1]